MNVGPSPASVVQPVRMLWRPVSVTVPLASWVMAVSSALMSVPVGRVSMGGCAWMEPTGTFSPTFGSLAWSELTDQKLLHQSFW